MAVRYEEPHPGPRGNPLLSFVREHVPLVGSGVAALIFAIRCVAVADGHIYVATLLLAQTSLADAIRALLFFVLPVVLTILSYGLAIAAGRSMPIPRHLPTWDYSTSSQWRRLFWGFFWRFFWRSFTGWSGRKPIGLLAASLTVHFLERYLSGYLTWPSSVIDDELGQLIILFLGAIFWNFTRLDPALTQARVIILSILAVVLFLLTWPVVASLVDPENFWLPRERLVFEDDFANKKPPLIGYVLKTSGDHFVILNDDPRIIIEKQGRLRERAFCYPEEGYEEHFKDVGQDMPPCP
jgi:hypothetical protein